MSVRRVTYAKQKEIDELLKKPCMCVMCHICLGSGSTDFGDDDTETCLECDGTGITETCHRCMDIEDLENQ